MRLPLYNRDGDVVAHALVDPQDYARLARFRWSFDGRYVARYTTRAAGRRQRKIYLHRAVLGLVPGDGKLADHENGDKLDYRRANLRVATRAENQQNRIHPNVRNKSGYRGVRRVRAGRWQAEVRLGGRTHYLGQFADKREAARAASAFRAEHMPFSTT